MGKLEQCGRTDNCGDSRACGDHGDLERGIAQVFAVKREKSQNKGIKAYTEKIVDAKFEDLAVNLHDM